MLPFFVNNIEKVKMNFCSSSILNGCMKTAGNMNQHKHFNSHIASVRTNKFNWWIMLLGVHFDVYIQTISNAIVCHLFHEKIAPESFFNIQNAFHVPFIKILNQFFPRTMLPLLHRNQHTRHRNFFSWWKKK